MVSIILIFVVFFFTKLTIIAQHAEYNAIVSYNGKETLRDCTLYVTTAPCNVCAKLIAQTGIKKVQHRGQTNEDTKTLFKTCGIEFRL